MRKNPELIENKYADFYESFHNIPLNINETSCSLSPQLQLNNLNNQKLIEFQNQISSEILYRTLHENANFEQIISNNHNFPLINTIKIAKHYNNNHNTSLPLNSVENFQSSKPPTEINEKEVNEKFIQAKNLAQNNLSQKIILEDSDTSFYYYYDRAKSYSSPVECNELLGGNDKSLQNVAYKETLYPNCMLQDDKINCLKTGNSIYEIQSEVHSKKSNKSIKFTSHLEPSGIELFYQ